MTLNRPDHMNAFTLAMIDRWVEILEEAKDDDRCRVLVLTGAGKGFCSGVELDNLEGHEVPPIDRKHFLWKRIHRIALTLESFDKPIIAAINGVAVGAGLDMALMCDIRFAAKTARLSEGYVRVGLVPGDGGAYFLPRLIGIPRALELLWTGKFITGMEAEQMGLVDHATDDADLLTQTMELADTIAKQPPLVIQMTKRAVYQSTKTDLRTALDLISSHMAVIQSTDDSREALQAFRERRHGTFFGR